MISGPPNRPVRLAYLVYFAVFAVLGLTPGCNSTVDQRLKLAALSQDCLVNSDCSDPLVCAFKACHVQCASSRDCDGGARCLAADHPYKVCQLDSERKCTGNLDCAEQLICGVDGECRDACQTDAGCTGGQVCVSGTCADQNELDSAGRLTPAPGTTAGSEGTPCVYVSDCSAALLCRNQSCLPECKTDVDCEPGQACQGTRCELNGSVPKTCAYTSECEAARGERCSAGRCRCSCVEDRDCPSGGRCDGCACQVDPNAPKACHYNSECLVSGQICRDSACACECKADRDCGLGMRCDGCGCVSALACVHGKCDAGYLCVSDACVASCAGSLQMCGAACVDVTTDPEHCGSCEQRCASGLGCRDAQCTDLGLPSSCWDLHQRQPSAPSGVYALDPDGTNKGAPKFDAYCDMTNDGGGWTLALKADGTKTTFSYSQPIWEQTTPFHPESADLAQSEAKLDSFSRIPLGALRIVTESATGQAAAVVATEELSLFQGLHQFINGTRQTRLTNLGRAGWLSLFPGQAVVGTKCDLEGLDAEALEPDETLRIGVRLGILSSVADSCSFPEAYVGIGGQVGPNSACAQGPGPSVGGITACSGNQTFSAFGYVFVRELPRTCREQKRQDPTSVDGKYRLDPDGAGPLPAFTAHCDMTFDGGGWTLFFVQPQAGGSVEGIAVPGGNAYLPVAVVKELAALGEQVHLRTAGMAETRSITSIAGRYPIANLRRATVLNLNAGMYSATDPVNGWTGPRALTAEYLWQGCREDELADTYPVLYHACNNPGGLAIDAGHAGWQFLVDEDIEAYVR